MNKKRLSILARYLKNVPRRKFDMKYWVGNADRSDPTKCLVSPECGTTGCAMGHAATIPSFKRDGLRLKASWEHGKIFPHYRNNEGFGAAADFFDISFRDSCYLFDPDEYDRYSPTPKHVAKRIEAFIAQG